MRLFKTGDLAKIRMTKEGCDSLQVGKTRSKFLPVDDKRLVELVEDAVSEFGEIIDWVHIGETMGKTARQCRDRYNNYMCPSIVRSPWNAEEDALLRDKITIFGRSWARMVKFFPGRTAVSLKNRWNVITNQHDVWSPPQLSNMAISGTVHDFIGDGGKSPSMDWFDRLFSSDSLVTFLKEIAVPTPK